MNREKIISAILLEYCHLAPDGGADKINPDLLFKSIENLGYQDYFSAAMLSESLDVIDKMAPHLPEASVKKEKATKRLTDEDIKIIYEILGTTRINFTEEELQSIDMNTVNLPTEFSTGNEPIEPSSYSMMVSKLNSLPSDKKFKITYSETKLRIKGEEGKTLSVINVSGGMVIYDEKKNDFSKYFKQLLLWVKFYKEHKSKIVIQPAADPNEKTKISASSLKEYFDKNNPDNISFNLFVKNVSKIFNSNVKVDGAEYIAGTKKADIALTEDNKQNFWISFKASDYFSAENSPVLAKVGLRHYGMVNALSSQLANNPTWSALENKLLTGLKKNIKGIDLDKTTIEDFDKKTGRLISINKIPLAEYKFTDEQLLNLVSSNKAIQRMVTSDIKKKFLYFSRPFSGYLKFLDNSSTPEMKEIAGKAIYGLDFKIDGSAPFGPENCSVVMFSATQLMMEKHETDTSQPSLLIRTDAKGNVYPNPYLPLPEGEGDPIFRYLPTFEIITKSINDKHSFYVGNEQHLFLNCRITITANAKIQKDAVDLSK